MRRRRPALDPQRQAELLARLRRELAEREQSYRERALRMFPHVCASCGREFSGRRLKELTVHHKDHNHDNNPPDGSNWELLCIYCHDHEHEKRKMAGQVADGSSSGAGSAAKIANPFAQLDELLNKPTPPEG